MSNPNDNIKPLQAHSYNILNDEMALNPKLVFDLGANSGGMSVSMAGHAKFVHAFEPVPDMFDQLCAVAYQHRNIIPFRLAVSDVEQEIKNQTVFNTWSLLPIGSRNDVALDYVGKPGFDMRTVTIDRHAEIFGAPDFIKLDVDGYELRALRGAAKTLRKNPASIYFEYSYLPTFLGDKIEDLVSLIYNLGYRAWALDGNYVAETEADMLKHYPAHTSYDLMLVHRDRK